MSSTLRRCRVVRRFLVAMAIIALGLQSSPYVRAADAPAEKEPDALYALNADGTGWRKLFQLEGHAACGSPAVSPDGKSIAFDAWQVSGGRQQGAAKLFAVDIDGENPRELCVGQMPTWSADSKFLACSRGVQPYGVWIVKADGADHKHVRPAWGAQWSPDGKKIAFLEGNKIMTYDVETGAIAQVLGGDANPYQQVFWNLTWSPDSTQLCFKGRKPDGAEEIGLVDAAGAEFGLRVRYSGKGVYADFAWHPRGDRIVFAMRDPERNRLQLYQFDPDDDEPPVRLSGQDETRNNSDMCWTPDGEQLLVMSGDY